MNFSEIKAQYNLTDKQIIFCHEYVIDMNATRAYLAAYPSCRSKESAWAAASRSLGNVKVQKYLEFLREERKKKLEITEERVLAEYAKIAFYNALDVFTEDGSLKSIPMIDRHLGAAIHGLKIKNIAAVYDISECIQTHIHEIKFQPKDKALEALSKHLGLFEKDNSQRGDAQGKAAGDVLKEVAEYIFKSVDGATRGLPKPRSKK